MFETTRKTFLVRLSGNDGEAWHDFARLYGPLIRSYCRRAGLQAADADDVEQVILQSLSAALPGFKYDRARGRFRDYVGRIAANAVRRFLGDRGKRKAMRLSTSIGEQLGVECDLEAVWIDEWRNHHFEVAIRALRRQLEARTLDVFEQLVHGVSVAEVSVQFGMDKFAVYKINERVKKRLKEQIRKQMLREEECAPWT